MATVSLVQMPEHIFLRIQVAAGDPCSVYALDALARGAPSSHEEAWAGVLEEVFPCLFEKLLSEDFGGSFKQVYTRRAKRAEEWRRRKQKSEKEEAWEKPLPAPTKKPHNKLLFADNRQGPLADSTLGLKVCGRCGEKYAPSNKTSRCRHHEGNLVPYGLEAGALTRRDQQQVAKCGRFALRKIGGIAGRSRASKGRGHWSKGLGLPAALAGKTMVWEDVCIGPGEVLCAWSCCSQVGLFADGCQVGSHRPY